MYAAGLALNSALYIMHCFFKCLTTLLIPIAPYPKDALRTVENFHNSYMETQIYNSDFHNSYMLFFSVQSMHIYSNVVMPNHFFTVATKTIS